MLQKLKYTAFFLSLIARLVNGQGVVISVSGPFVPPNSASAFDGALAVGTDLEGVSWIDSGAFSDVTISIELDGNSGATGMAYLMNKIGTGTTTANQIAASAFDFPAASSLTPIFSGLDLGAGTFYLIVQQTALGINGDGYWLGTDAPGVTSAANVTGNGEYWYNWPTPSYAPASAFGGGSTTFYDYKIVGSPVPEPSASWLLLLAGGIDVLKYFQNRVGFRR